MVLIFTVVQLNICDRRKKHVTSNGEKSAVHVGISKLHGCRAHRHGEVVW